LGGYYGWSVPFRIIVFLGQKGETAKWSLFRVFAWRPFAPPHESTRQSMRCIFGYCLSYVCLARRKVAMRKPAKITIWRVLAWRPFAFSPRKHVYTTWHKSATIGGEYSSFGTRILSAPCLFARMAFWLANAVKRLFTKSN